MVDPVDGSKANGGEENRQGTTPQSATSHLLQGL